MRQDFPRIRPGDVGIVVFQQAPGILPRGLKRSAMALDNGLIPPQHFIIIHGVSVNPAHHHPGLIGMVLRQGQKYQP